MEYQVIFDYLKDQLLTNDFFSGAALAGVLLGFLHSVRGRVARGILAIRNRFITSITVHSEDDLFVPLGQWLVANRFDRFAKRYRVRYDSEEKDVRIGPEYGRHIFRHNGKWFWVRVVKEDGGPTNLQSSTAQTREFLTLSCIGWSNSKIMGVLSEARSLLKEDRQDKIFVYSSGRYGDYWNRDGELDRNSRQGTVLAGDALEKLDADVQKFLGRREWYRDRGIPFRRGYLFYGPPGTGKTSLARHVARRTNRDLYVIGAEDYASSAITGKIRALPKGSILLMEDVDCFVGKRDKDAGCSPAEPQNKKEDRKNGFAEIADKINIGRLLNALDGVISVEDVIVIMTTNHIDRLDSALIRPGRIDYKLEVSYCKKDQAGKLFRKFHEGSSRGFEEAIDESRNWTPADLQELLLTAVDGNEAIRLLKERQK